ncbi:LPD7 domain-containing protein [Bosea sp. Root483D1]|uniref:LPD7 domain-containing protein n=1 Tax=Bosea sp. Root483D1 TaxID=1736544 RepID=UPI000A7C82C7|nr:LPD7 domain-containing protein [Bosea sp. Root483D1]
MDGDRKIEAEFAIEHGPEKDRAANRSSGASPRAKAEQAEFDLGPNANLDGDTAMPERLRRKYYVAEAGAGNEAKVYADPKGEYLAFKVSVARLATRLEDAGVIRDMVSIAQHRSWRELELRGSEEFRRTAWLEASVRGLSVRGYEPDPVDRAALSFRTKAEDRSTRAPSQSRRPEAEASETKFVAGVSTKRPIDVTVPPPERSTQTRRQTENDPAPFQGPIGSDRSSSRGAYIAGQRPADRPGTTIEVVQLRAAASHQSSRIAWQRRAEMFRSGDRLPNAGDDVVRAARSQLAAIERALTKAIRDPELRRTVVAHAKERIAEQLERGGEFKHAELRERTPHSKRSPEGRSDPRRQNRSDRTEVQRER